jgi:hypothetical protein
MKEHHSLDRRVAEISLGVGFLRSARGYVVLPTDGDVTPIFAFNGIRKGIQQTRESWAAKRAARGRKWEVVRDVQLDGEDGVRVLIPTGELPTMKQSLSAHNFYENERPPIRKPGVRK